MNPKRIVGDEVMLDIVSNVTDDFEDELWVRKDVVFILYFVSDFQ